VLSEKALGNGKTGGQETKSIVGNIPLVGKLLEPFAQPALFAGQVKSTRSAMDIPKEQKVLIGRIKSFSGSTAKYQLPAVEQESEGGIKIGQLNESQTTPKKIQGTALQKKPGRKNKTEKESNVLIKPFTKNDQKKSVTTNVQARYAKETPKAGTGRRNTSAEIVKRAIETKSPTARQKLLSDFPEARNPEKMTRRQQDKFLRSASKARYK
jgi:hypothetical protein